MLASLQDKSALPLKQAIFDLLALALEHNARLLPKKIEAIRKDEENLAGALTQGLALQKRKQGEAFDQAGEKERLIATLVADTEERWAKANAAVEAVQTLLKANGHDGRIRNADVRR